MAGYVRQSSAEIADALTIEAVDLNNEFNDLVAAFSNTSGHKHDGTAAEGPVISVLGDAGVATPLNKILVDTANKYLEFYTDVGSAAVQQLRIQDGAIVPILTNDIDLGTSSLEFKDIHIDGTASIDTLVIGSSTGITSVDTDLTSVSASDDTLASAKAIKAAIDLIPVGDITSVVAGTGLTGGGTTGDVTLNVVGGTGITANADDIAIDSSVVTLTDTQALSAKTLTSPVLNGTLSGTAFLDEDTLSSDSAIAVASQQSIKAYIDNNVSSVTPSSVTTFTNKTIDVDATGNSITNLVNANIKAAAAIDASKIADGSVSSAEFQRLDGLTSDIQTQLDLKAALASPALTGNPTAPTQSASDNSTKLATTAYVDASPVGDLTAIVAGTGLSGTDLTGPIPTLTIDTGTTVDKTTAQILTNKSIDSDNNTITNIVNADIKAAAAIDATKIADGSVSDTEFQRLDGLTSDIQTQLDLKAALASPDLTGNPTAPTQSASDISSKLATTAYVDGQVATENELSELNDVTIAGIADANYLIYDNAASVWKNKAISGAFTSDNLGVTTLSALIDSTKKADGTVTNTEFQYINTLSSNAQTQIDTKATAGFAVAMAIAL